MNKFILSLILIISVNQPVVAETNICHQLARNSSWVPLLITCQNKAIENDDPIAAYILGYMFQNGVHVAKNLNKAVAWYSLASDNGHAQAKMNLGVMVLKGEGVSNADKSSGMMLITQAATLDHKPAIELLNRLEIHNFENPIPSAFEMEDYLYILNNY